MSNASLYDPNLLLFKISTHKLKTNKTSHTLHKYANYACAGRGRNGEGAASGTAYFVFLHPPDEKILSF